MENGETMTDKAAQQKLEKARFQIETANRFRLIFLFVAFLILLFMLLGGKVFDEAAWFEGSSRYVMYFLYGDIALMLVATLIKFGFVIKYNRIVKNM